jgi:hypothetical protein
MPLQLFVTIADLCRAENDCSKDCLFLSFGEPPHDCPFHWQTPEPWSQLQHMNSPCPLS